MIAAPRTDDGDIRELSVEDGWSLLEREARQSLQMSAREFIDKWRAGAFGNLDADPDVLDVVMLLPFVGIDPWDDERIPSHSTAD